MFFCIDVCARHAIRQFQVNGNVVTEADTPLYKIETRGDYALVTTAHDVCVSFNGNRMTIRMPEQYKRQV